MKKSVFLSIVLPLVVLAFTGCKDDKCPCHCSRQVIEYNVYKADWKYSDLGAKEGNPYANNYFFCTFDAPELTEDVFKYGNVEIYDVFNNEMQHVLPYVRHYEEYNAADSVWNYYTETVDAYYGVGWIEFQLSSSDFMYEDDLSYMPNAATFRVVITR